VRLNASSRGDAVTDAKSMGGRGADENCEMDAGQTLLIKTSINCDDDAASRMAARDL
jgi:hypothetical protein